MVLGFKPFSCNFKPRYEVTIVYYDIVLNFKMLEDVIDSMLSGTVPVTGIRRLSYMYKCIAFVY